MTSTHDLATPDLNDPIYTIEHIARLFFVSVDRAREYTYRDSFPAPADLGARNLWTRAAVLAWFEGLPHRAKECRTSEPVSKNSDTATRTDLAKRTARARREPAGTTAFALTAATALEAGVATGSARIKKYQPRAERSGR